VDGPVGRITLARPDKLNALNRAALEELGAAARWFDARPVPSTDGGVDADIAGYREAARDPAAREAGAAYRRRRT
jgi:enoyl-CoA hydratase/carnithine racemase